ncbi:hypothetical protein BC826DRAFT_306922 [Russula brevipes]|nr:hypothetical protein BC826DRAFT_306922 [Russula brevipes]
MSAAAAREARRKAILSRGTERLSKLATSARGDDAPQFVRADSSIPSSTPRENLANFIGEDPLPTPLGSDQPRRRAPDPHRSPLDAAAGLGESPPEPSAWLNDQQQQFLHSLLGGPPPSGPRIPDVNAPGTNFTVPDNPLLALMTSLGVEAGKREDTGGSSQSRMEEKPEGRPKAIATLAYHCCNTWSRWARLASNPAESVWGIEIVPFFWAFVSLELALNSTRIFFHFDSTQPPLPLRLVLPYLPKPLPSMIMYGMKHLQLLGTLVDDLAAAVVAIGLFIVASTLYENWLLP